MTKPMKSARFVLILSLVAVTGCFSLSRDEPVQQHYVLGGDWFAERQADPDFPAGLTVALRRLDLAEYLKSPFIVVRQGPQQIQFSESRRWGEDPAEGITRTVASSLASRSPFRAVDTVPWPRGVVYDYTIQLHVTRFEGAAPESVGQSESLAATIGEARLSATWEIFGPVSVLERGMTEFRAPWEVGDYASLVALLDTGLDKLVDDLLVGLKKIARP